jgi:hypothetical protein
MLAGFLFAEFAERRGSAAHMEEAGGFARRLYLL